MSVRKKALAVAVFCTLTSVGFITHAYAAQQETAAEQPLARHQLAEVVVEGRRYIAGEYVRATSNIGILGERDAMTSPISVLTISEKSINDFNSSTDGLSGILSLAPSIRISGNASADVVSARGFALNGYDMYLNGVPGMFAMYRQTLNYIDSIDVIEGPATGITGSGYNMNPGATINVNSKVATDKPVTDIGIAYYSQNSFEQKIDIGRRFGKDNRYGIRVNASNVNGERGIDHWKLDQKNIYVNFDQQSKNSKTNFLIGYVDTDSQGRPVAMNFANNLSNIPAAPDGSVNFNPQWRRDQYTNFVMTLNHEQRINDHTKAFLNAGYHHQDWYYCLENQNIKVIDNAGNYQTDFEMYPLSIKKKYLQVGIRGDFKLGTFKHDYVLAADKEWRYYGGIWGDVGNGQVFNGNIYNPNTQSWNKPNNVDAVSVDNPGSRSKATGWSIMDTISTADGKLQVMLGLHGHKITEDSYNVTTGAHKSGYSSDAINPSFGINYAVNPKLSLYANHTENFTVGSMVSGGKYTNNGEVLPPSKTKQDEIGVKFKTGDFFHKLSYFDIEKANIYDHDLGGGKYYRSIDGRQKNKGFEYTATGSLGGKLNLIGGFMYLDAKQSKTASASSNGKRVNGAPEWSATLGAEYQATKELSFLLRASYLGSAYIQDEKYNVPGYFKFDLGAKYKTKIKNTPVEIRAMVYNVTGKNYWQPQSGSNSLYLGTPRTVMLSANFAL